MSKRKQKKKLSSPSPLVSWIAQVLEAVRQEPDEEKAKARLEAKKKILKGL